MSKNPSPNVAGTGTVPRTVPGSGDAPTPPSSTSQAKSVWEYLSQSWKILSTNSKSILSWLGISGAFGYATLYARPIWAGIALLAIALVTGLQLWRSRKDKRRIGAWILISLLFLMAATIIGSAEVRNLLQRTALAHFYSLNPKNLDFRVRRKLLALTADHGTWDQIRKVEVRDVTLVRTKVLDEQSAKRAEVLLEILRPSDDSSEDQHFVTFLVAPFGSGKETIMRQWALALAQQAANGPETQGQREGYRYVFFLNLNSYPEAAKEESWQKILAKSYREIVDDPAYYDLLFKREKCVILVSGLDRLEDDKDRKHLLTVAKDLASNSAYKVDFLFAIRPDTILRDFAIAAELRFDRNVRFLRVLDWNKCEWDAYFEQAGLKTVPGKNYGLARRLVEGDVLSKTPSDSMCQTTIPLGTYTAADGQNLVASKLAVNLDYLNLIVEQAQRLEPGTPGFYLCGEMVSRIMERDRTLDNEQRFQAAFANMEQLALKASLADTTNLEIDGRISHDILHSLRGAPLLSVEDGRFVFHPDVVHSYFAVRGLNKALIDIRKVSGQQAAPEAKPVDFRVWYGKPITGRLLQDISVFAPLPQELDPIAQFVACVAKKNPGYYSQAENREQKKLVENIIKKSPSAPGSDCL